MIVQFLGFISVTGRRTLCNIEYEIKSTEDGLYDHKNIFSVKVRI